MKENIATFFGIFLLGVGAIVFVFGTLLLAGWGFQLIATSVVDGVYADSKFEGWPLFIQFSLGWFFFSLLPLCWSKKLLHWEWRDLINIMPADCRILLVRFARIRGWQKSIALIVALFIFGVVFSNVSATWYCH
jgi:hypothetical protein